MSAKKKLQHFAEFASFPHTVEPTQKQLLDNDFHLKGRWADDFFRNTNPIVLELGCGKGEYTLGNARLYPQKNFIGMDIKGARMWRGARTSLDEGLRNVAFLRSRIELIKHIFGPNEVDEIWFTFPDPQVKKVNKRLTGSRFLTNYQALLRPNGLIHLKTDSDFLFAYTRAIVAANQLEVVHDTDQLYQSPLAEHPLLSIRTHYEKMWLQQGYITKYICFRLDGQKTIVEPEFEFEGPKR